MRKTLKTNNKTEPLSKKITNPYVTHSHLPNQHLLRYKTTTKLLITKLVNKSQRWAIRPANK